MAEIGAAPPLQELEDMTLRISRFHLLFALVGMRQRLAAQDALKQT